MHAPPPSSTPLRPSQQPKSKNGTLGRARRQRTADWGRDRLDERQKQHAARNNATGDAQLRARSATTHLSLPSRCLLVSTSIAVICNIQRIREDMTLRFWKQEVGSWKLEVRFSQLCSLVQKRQNTFSGPYFPHSNSLPLFTYGKTVATKGP